MKSSAKSVLHSRGSRQQRGNVSSRHKSLSKSTATKATKEPSKDASLSKTASDTAKLEGTDFKKADAPETNTVESGKVFHTTVLSSLPIALWPLIT